MPDELEKQVETNRSFKERLLSLFRREQHNGDSKEPLITGLEHFEKITPPLDGKYKKEYLPGFEGYESIIKINDKNIKETTLRFYFHQEVDPRRGKSYFPTPEDIAEVLADTIFDVNGNLRLGKQTDNIPEIFIVDDIFQLPWKKKIVNTEYGLAVVYNGDNKNQIAIQRGPSYPREKYLQLLQMETLRGVTLSLGDFTIAQRRSGNEANNKQFERLSRIPGTRDVTIDDLAKRKYPYLASAKTPAEIENQRLRSIAQECFTQLDLLVQGKDSKFLYYGPLYYTEKIDWEELRKNDFEKFAYFVFMSNMAFEQKIPRAERMEVPRYSASEQTKSLPSETPTPSQNDSKNGSRTLSSAILDFMFNTTFYIIYEEVMLSKCKSGQIILGPRMNDVITSGGKWLDAARNEKVYLYDDGNIDDPGGQEILFKVEFFDDEKGQYLAIDSLGGARRFVLKKEEDGTITWFGGGGGKMIAKARKLNLSS